ncbi:very short patch repair endonuclease [Micromonospora sp. C28ISP2-4]|uniref:very short patch repair endonuclease n=1 Tax=Micromonospora sp. C28ISP2-4 TaxID=3059523 RepID=UPI002674D162|nr:very short patch repair endonuclease [Micromonospora sp. C28ISP2-4]MDO3682799.1 very short patch repair endonuclease [Micromonospora sp. C28ISP2-4]
MPERPVPSSTGVSGRMQRQRRKDTEPELALRRELHRAGLRYRIGLPVVGSPRRTIDIAFTRIKLAVFVDGCFWHGCPQHATWPKANAAWWEAKILKNRERDRETSRRLEQAGWTVIRIWEHEPAGSAASRLVGVVRDMSARVALPRGRRQSAARRSSPYTNAQ